MAESRGGDCLIKLFGMTIPVPENGSDAKDLQHSGSGSSSIESDVQENAHQKPDASDQSPQPEVVDAEDPREQQQPASGCGSEEKEKLKKPDKIVPCPRCSSMDTKFCYFNNYNVNQPRHFCKNCQRYWTAGGAMRNVPVGAGRRKNKNAAAAAHFLQRVRASGAGGCEPLDATNGTVLSFGAPAAQIDLKEQPALLVPVGNAGDASVGSSSEGSINRDEDRNCHAGVIKEKQATMERPAANGAVQHPTAMNGATMWPYNCAPPPAFYSSGFAIPVYPAAPGYWGCMVPPGAWSLPWPAVQSPATPTSQCAPSATSSGPDDHSLSLGKHPRDQGDDEGRGRHGGGGKVWVPKTIRIDDADEVAKSSIWSLIGIKGDKKDAADTGMHKLGTMFEPKTAKQEMIASSPLLHANPVALTRSVTFQEGS